MGPHRIHLMMMKMIVTLSATFIFAVAFNRMWNYWSNYYEPSSGKYDWVGLWAGTFYCLQLWFHLCDVVDSTSRPAFYRSVCFALLLLASVMAVVYFGFCCPGELFLLLCALFPLTLVVVLRRCLEVPLDILDCLYSIVVQLKR